MTYILEGGTPDKKCDIHTWRGGHRTKRDIRTSAHTERLNDMQLYIVRLNAEKVTATLNMSGKQG